MGEHGLKNAPNPARGIIPTLTSRLGKQKKAKKKWKERRRKKNEGKKLRGLTINL